VIDRNISKDDNICFKYYLGNNRKNQLKVLLHRNTEFDKWVRFLDASEDIFEVFYSAQSSVSTNKSSIHDSSIKKMRLKTDIADEDAFIYLRIISPTSFEYVVAGEEGILTDHYLSIIKTVTI
jgi:hypothetical protein